MHCLPALEARSLRSRCQQGWVLPSLWGSTCSRPLSWLLAALGIPQLREASLRCICLHVVCSLYISTSASLCTSGSKFPLFYKDTRSYWSRAYLCSCVCSGVSNSSQTHGLELTRLLCPWDSPGKNTGAGCHFLLQGIFPTQGLNPRLLCLLH